MTTCHGALLYLHAAAHRVVADPPLEGHVHLIALDAGDHGEAQAITRQRQRW